MAIKGTILAAVIVAASALAAPVTAGAAVGQRPHSDPPPQAGEAISHPIQAGTGIMRDPAQGPHARDQGRHDAQRLALPRATSTPRPLGRTATPRALPNATARVNPTLLPSNPRLAREVFGFAPYWAISNTSNWNFSLLSTVAYFGLDVRSDGSFDTSATNNGFIGWQSAALVNVINSAHAANDRVVLVIKAFDDGTINAIVSNPGATQNAINWTIQSIRSKNLDGVNIDFEGSTNGSYPNLQSQYSAFVANLSNQVHAAIPGSVVSVDTYSGSASWDGGFMNIGQLAPSVDSLFVMAYDMGFGNLPGQAAPNAPLNGWTYNDTTSVQQYLSKAPASKVILGVPYYGYKWSTTSNQPYATTTGGATADTFSGVVDDLSCGAQQLSRGWDTTADSPWASWWSPPSNDPCGGNHNSWRELYYDDMTSIMAKYDLVNHSNLQGTGMWALGYDGSHPDLWMAIDAKMRASWAATFDNSAVPASWAVNMTRQFTVSVTNVGNSTWPSTGTSPVRVALHFLAAGTGSWLTDQRFALPSDVVPGQSVSLTVAATAPATTNVQALQVALVKEGELWFKQWASTPTTMQGAIWTGGYDASLIPRTWTYGQTQSFTVKVTNTGNQTWPSSGATAVRLGLHFAGRPAAGWTNWLSDQRYALPSDLPPGQSATIAVDATAPATSGAAVLEAELVKEQQFWFFQTSPVAVTVAAPAFAATYDLSQAPRTWSAGQTQTFALSLTNSGNQPWPSTGNNPVRLGLHFAPDAGLPYSSWMTDQRINLPADVGPGQTVSLTVTASAPSAGAPVVLEAEAVKEWQFWFAQSSAVGVGQPATWLAGYDLSGVPRNWVQGQSATVTLKVTNLGNQTWPAGGSNPVHLGLHFAPASGLIWDQWLSDQRVSLPADLAPGQQVTLPLTLTAPSASGAVVLEAAMVKEWQFWFKDPGSAVVTNAAPTWMAGYDLSQVPRTFGPGQTQSFTITVLNAGNQAWPATGDNPVHLGFHFAGDIGLPYSSWLSDQRFSLPQDLAPGQTVAVSVTATAPGSGGGPIVEAEMVKEWQFWFAERAAGSFLAS